MAVNIKAMSKQAWRAFVSRNLGYRKSNVELGTTISKTDLFTLVDPPKKDTELKDPDTHARTKDLD